MAPTKRMPAVSHPHPHTRCHPHRHPCTRPHPHPCPRPRPHPHSRPRPYCWQWQESSFLCFLSSRLALPRH